MTSSFPKKPGHEASISTISIFLNCSSSRLLEQIRPDWHEARHPQVWYGNKSLSTLVEKESGIRDKGNDVIQVQWDKCSRTGGLTSSFTYVVSDDSHVVRVFCRDIAEAFRCLRTPTRVLCHAPRCNLTHLDGALFVCWCIFLVKDGIQP